MTDNLVNVALNRLAAIQREIQGLKNFQVAALRRIDALEALTLNNDHGQETAKSVNELAGLCHELTDRTQALDDRHRDAESNSFKLENRVVALEQQAFAEAPSDTIGMLQRYEAATGAKVLQSKTAEEADGLVNEPQTEVVYPLRVAGTTGRGVKYQLSDGTIFSGPRFRAVEAELKLATTPEPAA